MTALIAPAPADDTTHPAIAAFVDTLPAADATLLGLADAYAALAERRADLHRRRAVLTARLPVLDTELADAEGQARAALLGERGLITAELASMPASLATTERRHASAHLGWLRRLAVAAKADAQRHQDELAGALVEMAALKREVWQMRPADDHAAMHVRMRALETSMAPAVDRRDRALMAAGVAQALAEQRYGDVRLVPDPRRESLSFEAAAERAARRVA